MTKKIRKTRKTAKTMLREIVKFLNTGNYGETNDLWTVLTALRGPDEDSFTEHLKRISTARIRHAVGLVGGIYTKQGALVNQEAPNLEVVREHYRKINREADHFLQHFKLAVEVLGGMKLIKKKETK